MDLTRDTIQGGGYRHDIDGLRGLAVLAVLVYHAFPRLLPGGYAGVDVFFAISGYVITRRLMGDLDQPYFGIPAFYTRRVRRLFPALGIVLAATLLLGWPLLLRSEMKELGAQVAASSAFSANFLFWTQAGYFDAVGVRKPLLHLWSLGVEEQFYLTWPLLLAAMFRWKRERVPLLASILAGLSLASFVALRGHPDSAYYLPFARYWELLAGCLIALSGWRLTSPWASLTGLIGIVASFWALGSSTPVQYMAAPVVGAALTIAGFAQPLCARWLVGLGRISYPLYLWHWPLLALGRISGLGPVASAGIMAVSFPLAWMTYRFVEHPIRIRARSSDVGWLIGAVTATAALGLAVYVGDGRLGQTHSTDVDAVVAEIRDRAPLLPCGWSNEGAAPPATGNGMKICHQTGRGEVFGALLGDSHALTLLEGLAIVDPGRNWLAMGALSCPPVLEITAQRIDRGPCAPIMEAALRRLSGLRLDGPVILGYLGSYSDPPDPMAYRLGGGTAPVPFLLGGGESRESTLETGLSNTIQKLTSDGRRVVVVVDNPKLPFLPEDCLRPWARPGSCTVPRSEIERRQSGVRRVVASLQGRFPKLEVFDPLPTLCGRGDCTPVVPPHTLYRDDHHLSTYGSTLTARALLQQIDSGFSKR